MSLDSTGSRHHEKRRHGAWVDTLVRRIQRGQAVEAHFELLFRAYEPKIRALLRLRGFDAELDDMVQDVMCRVYRGIGSFRLEASFDTWILTIMSNVEKNTLRGRNTGKARVTRASLEERLDDSDGPALPEPQSAEDDPLDSTLAKERKARLLAALHELPPRVRQCLFFRYQGYKYREIAAAQGVSIDTVKKQIGQGYKSLRPILGSFAEIFGLVLAILLLI